MLGERIHAGRRLAGAHRADDQDAGVEPVLGDDEPGGPLGLAGNGRMVQLTDHDGRRRIAGRRGPRRQLALAAALRPRLEPDSPDRDGEAAGEERGDAGRGVIPDLGRRVERRIVVGDEVEHGVAAGAGERRREGVPEHGTQRSAQEEESPEPHRVTCLPAGILGRERPRRGQWRVKTRTVPRHYQGVRGWGRSRHRRRCPSGHGRPGSGGVRRVRVCGYAVMDGVTYGRAKL